MHDVNFAKQGCNGGELSRGGDTKDFKSEGHLYDIARSLVHNLFTVYIMAIFTTAVVWLLATAAAAESSVASLSGGEKIACSKLKSRYQDHTFLPGSSEYAYETQIREFLSLGNQSKLTSYSLLVRDNI